LTTSDHEEIKNETHTTPNKNKNPRNTPVVKYGGMTKGEAKQEEKLVGQWL